MNQLASFLTFDNPLVLHTVFALVSAALFMTGVALGHRAATNGKLCVVLGLGIGLATMALLATPLACFSPGWALVFIGGFLASEKLASLMSGK